MPAPKITVAICTYNRCDSLKRVLEDLERQAGVAWPEIEILVIDNNCTDRTAEVVEGFAPRLPIRRIVETSQGLSHARNRALAEAGGEWLLFTDDDVALAPEWLSAYLTALAEHPTAAFAGGRMEPAWPDGAPTWYRGERLQLLDGILARCSKGEKTRLIEAGETLFFGASFAVRADAAARIGAFRADLGMRGSVRALGEETDYLLRAQSLGMQGLYVADSLCWHPVERERLTMRGLFRYGVASGLAHRAIVDPAARGSRKRALSYLARGCFQLLKGRGDRFRECVINAGVQTALKRH